jgi:ubiquinone/menaquinone biosynthesis C-methylase UbiE
LPKEYNVTMPWADRGSAVSRTRPSQFYELAEYYDCLNEWKDYPRETRDLEAIVRRSGLRGRTSWLDVACGTGRHLEFLRRKHPVVGVDLSREMLNIARDRLPGVCLVRGDMRTFRLKRRFDVVSCLFSAIGHLRTNDDVQRAFKNFARHLNPGGIAVVEPWIDPSKFRSGYVHLRTYKSPDLAAARLAYSERRGGHSVVHFHFLTGKPDRGFQYREVVDVGLLLSRRELLRLMGAAGLRPRFLSTGLLTGRGLLIGRKAGPGG